MSIKLSPKINANSSLPCTCQIGPETADATLLNFFANERQQKREQEQKYTLNEEGDQETSQIVAQRETIEKSMALLHNIGIVTSIIKFLSLYRVVTQLYSKISLKNLLGREKTVVVKFYQQSQHCCASNPTSLPECIRNAEELKLFSTMPSGSGGFQQKAPRPKLVPSFSIDDPTALSQQQQQTRAIQRQAQTSSTGRPYVIGNKLPLHQAAIGERHQFQRFANIISTAPTRFNTAPHGPAEHEGSLKRIIESRPTMAATEPQHQKGEIYVPMPTTSGTRGTMPLRDPTENLLPSSQDQHRQGVAADVHQHLLEGTPQQDTIDREGQQQEAEEEDCQYCRHLDCEIMYTPSASVFFIYFNLKFILASVVSRHDFFRMD